MSFQPVFSATHKVIGHIVYDTFRQWYDNDDIFNDMNAKGLDYSTYLNIVNKVHFWTITHKQTKRSLTMPIMKVHIVGVVKDMGARYGKQIMVRLDDFNMEKPAVQREML